MGFFSWFNSGDSKYKREGLYVGTINYKMNVNVMDKGKLSFVSKCRLICDIFYHRNNYELRLKSIGDYVNDSDWENVSVFNNCIRPLQYNMITPFLDLLHSKEVYYSLYEDNLRLKSFRPFSLND